MREWFPRHKQKNNGVQTYCQSVWNKPFLHLQNKTIFSLLQARCAARAPTVPSLPPLSSSPSDGCKKNLTCRWGGEVVWSRQNAKLNLDGGGGHIHRLNEISRLAQGPVKTQLRWPKQTNSEGASGHVVLNLKCQLIIAWSIFWCMVMGGRAGKRLAVIGILGVNGLVTIQRHTRRQAPAPEGNRKQCIPPLDIHKWKHTHFGQLKMESWRIPFIHFIHGGWRGDNCQIFAFAVTPLLAFMNQKLPNKNGQLQPTQEESEEQINKCCIMMDKHTHIVINPLCYNMKPTDWTVCTMLICNHSTIRKIQQTDNIKKKKQKSFWNEKKWVEKMPHGSPLAVHGALGHLGGQCGSALPAMLSVVHDLWQIHLYEPKCKWTKIL